jgi:hypothetical protein
MCRPRHPERPGLHPVAREHVENQKALQCQVELETPIWPAPEGGGWCRCLTCGLFAQGFPAGSVAGMWAPRPGRMFLGR